MLNHKIGGLSFIFVSSIEGLIDTKMSFTCLGYDQIVFTVSCDNCPQKIYFSLKDLFIVVVCIILMMVCKENTEKGK